MNFTPTFEDCIQSLEKTIKSGGSSSQKPNDGSLCTVSFQDVNCQFDTSYLSNKTLTFTIGDACTLGDRIVDYCVRNLTIEESAVFSINSLSSSFTAQLQDCEFLPYSHLMTPEDKYALAQRWKERGVTLFKAGAVEQAFCMFRKSLQYTKLVKLGESEEDITDLAVNLYNNLAQCHLQCLNYDSVVPMCTKSLMVMPNVKAYYRRALAFIESGDYENAEQDLLECLKLDPKNKMAQVKLDLVLSLDQDNRESYKETIKRMFK